MASYLILTSVLSCHHILPWNWPLSNASRLLYHCSPAGQLASPTAMERSQVKHTDDGCHWSQVIAPRHPTGYPLAHSEERSSSRCGKRRCSIHHATSKTADCCCPRGRSDWMSMERRAPAYLNL